MRTLSVSLVVMLLIASFGVGWLVDTVYSQYREERDVDKLRLMEELGKSIALTLDAMQFNDEFVQYWQSLNDKYQLRLTVIDDLALPPDLTKQAIDGEILLLESIDSVSFHYYLPNKQQVLIIRLPTDQLDAGNENSINYLFTAFFYLALMLVMTAWSYPLLMRLLRLRKIARALGKGDLSQRIELSRFSYIRDIEAEFNKMATRLESLVSDVKMLSGAVSHDLRTPLARIQMGVDTLCEESDPIERRKYEEKINKNIREMTLLVETLLQYARLDQSMLSLNMERVDINTLVQHSLSSIDSEALMLDVKIGVKPLFVDVDKAYLKMAINNILDNAVKFGHGTVNVSTSEKDGFACIAISDNGNGIEVSERNKMLQPFVRGNEGKSKGYGFGLSVVKRIIDWHNGDLELTQCEVLCGARFVIRLPLSPMY